MLCENNFDEELLAKTKVPQNLNLDNFECNEAIYSPYILTSPRSLKACQLANIKPIELLHRSLEDVALDLNLDKCQANNIYFDREQERRKKLEMCKLIRKHILTFEQLRSDSRNSLSPIYHNKENPSNFTYSRGDFSDGTPDLLKIKEKPQLLNSYSVPATPQIQYNSLKKKKNKLISFSLSNSSNSLLSLNSNSPDDLLRSSSTENRKHKHVKTKGPNKTYFSKTKTSKNNLNRISLSTNSHINDRELCWEIDKTKKAENDLINKKIQAEDESKRKLKENKKVSINQRTTLRNNTSIKNHENSPKASALEERKKYSAHLKKAKTTIKKRNYESQVNSKSRTKEKNLENKKTDCNPVCKDVKFHPSPKEENLRNHDAGILDVVSPKREKQECEDNLSCKANATWDFVGEGPNKNNNLDRVDSKNLKSINCACHENLALDAYFQQIRDRIKQLKENCLYKELHGEHVRQLARELQIGMERWQDQVLLLQWKALQRAQTNAKLLLENKRLKTQSENKERTLMHALRFRNVLELERIKQQITKKEIEEKYNRIKRLKMKREQEILSCRAQAHYTAELREQLRHTLTPETFDRKVTDVQIKSKFINRLLTSNPLIESKIRLG